MSVEQFAKALNADVVINIRQSEKDDMWHWNCPCGLRTLSGTKDLAARTLHEHRLFCHQVDTEIVTVSDLRIIYMGLMSTMDHEVGCTEHCFRCQALTALRKYKPWSEHGD